MFHIPYVSKIVKEILLHSSAIVTDSLFLFVWSFFFSSFYLFNCALLIIFKMLIYFSIICIFLAFFRNNFLFNYIFFFLIFCSIEIKLVAGGLGVCAHLTIALCISSTFSTRIDILFLFHSLTRSLVFLIYYIVYYYMHGSRRTDINSTDKLFSIWIANGKWQIYYI